MACLVQESKAIVRFLAEELGPDTYINLMAQYIPSGLVGKATAREPYQEIHRHVHREEYGELVEFAASLGLRRLDARAWRPEPSSRRAKWFRRRRCRPPWRGTRTAAA